MADLGVLRTFVNTFGDALDILDEAARIKATVEERRAELTQLTQERDTQRAAAASAAQAAQAARDQQELAEASAKDQQRIVADKLAAAQHSFGQSMANLDRQFQEKKTSYAAELDRLDQVAKAKIAEAKAAEERLAQTRAAMRDLAASVR